jgi:nitrogenase-stabilizing/protective protein
VGHTLDCMIERIRRLEDEFRELSRGAETHPAVVPATTPDCQAGTGLACDECACQPGDTPPDHRDTPPPSHPEPCRSTPMEDATLEEALAELSTAEDFLDHFGITYDPAVVQVNRLHILQRYHDYLANNPAPQGDDGAVRAHYRRFLELAYRDFTASDAVTEKVFAVFRKTSGTAFVPLDAVRR